MAARPITLSESFSAFLRPLRNLNVLVGLAALVASSAAVVHAAHGHGSDEWTFTLWSALGLLVSVIALRRASRSFSSADLRLQIVLALALGAERIALLLRLPIAGVATGSAVFTPDYSVSFDTCFDSAAVNPGTDVKLLSVRCPLYLPKGTSQGDLSFMEDGNSVSLIKADSRSEERRVVTECRSR